MTIQQLFLALCAAEGHRMCGADVQCACAQHTKTHSVKTCMRADDALIKWAREVLGKEMRKGCVMAVLHSLQGHPPSGKQWMEMMDEISIDDPGFSTIAQDRCVCKRTNSEGTILILRQVLDDFSVGTTDQTVAQRITKWIGERVKFQHKENPPITFLGFVDDCNGVDIKQFNDSVSMTPKQHPPTHTHTHVFSHVRH